VAVIAPRAVAIDLERGARVVMPDGVALATDVLRPQTSQPVPALLVRTPYGRDVGAAVAPVDPLRLAEAGYGVVTQDTRGRYGSDGTFRPFRDEPADGEATIAWIAEQPWCDGQVGMLGGSYVGATQWLAAGRAPAALKAFVPYVTAADYHEGWAYQGGAFQLGFLLRWTLGSLTLAHLPERPDPDPAVIDAIRRAWSAIAAGYERRPLTQIPELDDVAPYYREWLAHPTRDQWWTSVSPMERYEAITAPALNIGGWYDIFVAGTVANYRGLRDRGGSDAARNGSRLIVGPWSHTNVSRVYPERSFGWDADLDSLDPTSLHLRFFDRWLRGIDNGIDGEPPVRLFVMGVDRWQDELDWPPPDAVETAWYLHSAGRANTAQGDGALSATPPGDETMDVYVSDPRDPVPSIGGATLMPGGRPGWNDGPWDQAAAEMRADVLSYTSEPLDRALGVIGSIRIELHVASSAADTDLVAALVDVHPDGRAEILTEGILRARYRLSLRDPRPLPRDELVEVRIDLGPTANVFLPGHRVRVDIASSSFPRFDVNPQSGGDAGSAGPDELVVARNRVAHDSLHPSRLLLPVVDREWNVQ
jgi:putative CocE/NonD family hydrolase